MCTGLTICAGSLLHPAWKLLRDLGGSWQPTQHDVTTVANSQSKQSVTHSKLQAAEGTLPQ